MINDRNQEYTLRAKTGLTEEDSTSIGWWVGYVERGDGVYFFATRLCKPLEVTNDVFPGCRKNITLKVLRELHFIQ